jgi:site-specific recombinase XerD
MAGVDLYTVSHLLGHSSINVTEQYAHLAKDHKMEAVNKLNDVFSTPEKGDADSP